MTTQTHKWLPSEPTQEMVEALSDVAASNWLIKTVYKAMWQAAPEVEQEPVAWRRYLYNRWGDKTDYNYSTMKPSSGVDLVALYTHPQPKRESLSDAELSGLYKSLPLDTREDVCSYSFNKGFRQAEQAHGIGAE
jgi:hypothetical protein